MLPGCSLQSDLILFSSTRQGFGDRMALQRVPGRRMRATGMRVCRAALFLHSISGLVALQNTNHHHALDRRQPAPHSSGSRGHGRSIKTSEKTFLLNGIKISNSVAISALWQQRHCSGSGVTLLNRLVPIYSQEGNTKVKWFKGNKGETSSKLICFVKRVASFKGDNTFVFILKNKMKLQ